MVCSFVRLYLCKEVGSWWLKNPTIGRKEEEIYIDKTNTTHWDIQTTLHEEWDRNTDNQQIKWGSSDGVYAVPTQLRISHSHLRLLNVATSLHVWLRMWDMYVLLTSEQIKRISSMQSELNGQCGNNGGIIWMVRMTCSTAMLALTQYVPNCPHSGLYRASLHNPPHNTEASRRITNSLNPTISHTWI